MLRASLIPSTRSKPDMDEAEPAKYAAYQVSDAEVQ
jgi:hypothetical protein